MNHKKGPIGNHRFNLFLAVIGLLLATYGNFLPFTNTQKYVYLFASIFLLASSILERQLFFVLMQIVVLSGTTIALLSIHSFFKLLVPFSFSMIACLSFAATGALKEHATKIGCIGMVLLALGYAVSHPIIYLLGGASLTVYSAIAYKRGVDVALVFAILNAVFTVTASVAVYHRYF